MWMIVSFYLSGISIVLACKFDSYILTVSYFPTVLLQHLRFLYVKLKWNKSLTGMSFQMLSALQHLHLCQTIIEQFSHFRRMKDILMNSCCVECQLLCCCACLSFLILILKLSAIVTMCFITIVLIPISTNTTIYN